MSKRAGENGGVSQRPAKRRREASRARPLCSSQGPRDFSPASWDRRSSATDSDFSTVEVGTSCAASVLREIVAASPALGVPCGASAREFAARRPIGPDRGHIAGFGICGSAGTTRARNVSPAVSPSVQPPLAAAVAGQATKTPVSSKSSRRAQARMPGTRSNSFGELSLSAAAGVQPSGCSSVGTPASGKFASPRSSPPPGKACQPPMNGRISPRRSQKSSISPPARQRKRTTEAEPRGGFGAASSPPAAASTFSYSPSPLVKAGRRGRRSSSRRLRSAAAGGSRAVAAGRWRRE